jgi:hypothetical protein
MKQLAQLTAHDFSAVPVWKHHGGPDNRATVEPSALLALSEDTSDVYLAATEFRLADGTKMPGYCSPSDPSGMDYLQPVLFTAGGHVSLWSERPPTKASLAEAWRTLGKPLESVYPIEFTCVVPVDGRLISGLISLDDASAG